MPPDAAPTAIPSAATRRRGWRLMRDGLRHERLPLLAGVLSGIVWTAAKVSVPLLASFAIDRGIVHRSNHALVTFTVAIVVVGLVQGVCSGSRRYLATGVAARIETSLRGRLFRHLQRLDFSFHDRWQTGQLMSRANSDLQQIQFLLVYIPLAVANALTIVAVSGVLLSTNWRLALIALAPLPFVSVAATRFSTRVHPELLTLQQELAALSTVVEETVSGVRVVKGFGAEPRQAARLAEEAGDVFDASLRAAGVRASYLPLLDFLPALGLVAVLWYGGHQVLDGSLTIGQLVAFNAYVLMLVWPLRLGGVLVAQAQRAVAAAGRVAEILDTAAQIRDPEHPRPLPPGGGEVSFEGLSFGYDVAGDARVLDRLDLHVPAGAAVALVGATGSGKSTVARLLARFYDVTAGTIRIDGVDIRELSLADLRRAVGLVFEDTFLFSDSVRANIAFASPEVDDDVVRRAARLAGADTFIDELPAGLDTVIGQHGFSLSGGQRQRIAIARTILANPRVLVLDDATSAVDPTKEHEIRDALDEVMAGRTTIIIAHRPATIALADRVLLLDGGRIVAEGTHDELLAREPRYRELLARAAAADDALVDVS
jgi:ATP-binding cassette subfamily B protein